MHHFHYRLAIAGLFASLNAQQGWAAQSEQAYFQEFPVVLSASRLSQPLSETPNAVTVIDRTMIKASGFRVVADLFKLVPGMYVDYLSGNEPIVGYRGATDSYSRRMQVLIDGRSVYLPPYNIVDWGDLPLHLDDIERIEVVRGPAATSYGSNSILGVINIITRDAFVLNGANLSVTKGNTGNAGISDAVAHLGKHGEQLDYRLTLGMRHDNGFDFPASVSPSFDGYNDNSATHFFGLRSNYHPNARDSLDVQLGHSDTVRATGNPSSKTALYPPRNVISNYGYQQISWLHILNPTDDIQLHYYHISRNTKDERLTLPISGVTYWIADYLDAARHELELQHTLHTRPDNRLVWGAAVRRETADSNFLFLTPQSAQQYRLFAHDEWRIKPSLLLNAGAMWENDGMGNQKLSPKLSLNYHLTPEHTLRIGISVAYRNPALGEEHSNNRYILGANLYQYWLSSGGLHPERALSREVGYIGKLANGLSLDVRAYNDQVSDVIWVDALSVPNNLNGRAWDFRNEFDVHYTGVEGTLKFNWAANSLTLNYAHQEVSAALLTPSTFLPWAIQAFSKTVPLNSGSLLFSRQMNAGVSLSAGYYQQGSVMVLDGVKPQPLSRRLDWRLAKQFSLSDNKKISGGEIALVMQNAFQDNFVGYSGYQFDRRAFVTAAVDF